jgi:IS5 family transposase
VADCIAADVLLDHIAAAEILHGDKGYDSDAVRRKIESKGAAPNIPPKVNRRWKNCFSPYLYRNRNAIERSDASRTFAGSQLDTIASPKTSLPPSVSPLPCPTGYEAGA